MFTAYPPMSHQQSECDADLIHGCIAGDADCWNDLINRYGSLVYSVPKRLGLNDSDSEDIFQAVFSILANRLHSIDDPQALPKWLITTARRECWRHLRRMARRDELESEANRHAEVQDDGDQALDRHVAVRSALAGMGPRCRDLLTLLFLSPGRPDYEGVSAALGIPVGSIGPTRARCLSKLLAQLHAVPAAPELFPELASGD